MGASLGLVSAGLGIAGSLGGLFGGGGKNNAQNVQLPPMWNMPGRDQAAGGAMGGIEQLPNFNTWNIPGAQQVTQNLLNNPGAGMAMGGSAGAGAMGMSAAMNQFGQGTSLYPYAQQVMQTGFDPQSALYDRTRQQVQDQTRASQAARGTQTTPYGAGVENKAMSDFNIDWQNQQLQRQIQGGQAGSNMIGAGAQIAGGAAPLFMQSAMYPYQTGQQIGQNQFGALNQFGQFGQSASGLTQQQIQDYLNYVQAGNQAGGVANQTGMLGLQQANLGFNQQQTLGQNLGAGISQFGNALNKYPGQTGWGGSSGGASGWGGGGAGWGGTG